ncbi:hypothetical protein A9K55_008816 [Cordyceps militaris]|uniref:Uncharacterized protein n=1 Tax=Cordyceps militaris TaxID=73501 RepID=A0A2H4SIT9_CORMI|nr:hypothetical protein A9K55_008816 [Cordyceps militaris]
MASKSWLPSIQARNLVTKGAGVKKLLVAFGGWPHRRHGQLGLIFTPPPAPFVAIYPEMVSRGHYATKLRKKMKKRDRIAEKGD